MGISHWRWLLVVALAGCSNKSEDTGASPSVAPPAKPVVAVVDAAVAAKPAATVDAAAPADAAVVDIAAKAKAEYGELLDLRKRFVYEIVEGSSAANLKPVKGNPRAFGVMSVPEQVDGVTRTFLTIRPEGNVGAEYGPVAMQTIGIVFDEDGIRQLAALGGSPSNKENIRGFTFPNAVDKIATVKGHADFGPVTVQIKRQKLMFAGAVHDVLLAEAKLVEERANNAASYETFAYAPGVGPVLLCAASERRSTLQCVRYAATEQRSCARVAATLCAGKDATTCDSVFMKLLTDPDTGKPQSSTKAEAACEQYEHDPAKLDAVRKTVMP